MFTKVPHVFQNLGDGTYWHSGYLAIRQAVASKATITYKILFNDAVAMTGGQPVDGVISVDRVARQVESEGVEKVVVVSDDIDKYDTQHHLYPPGTEFHPREAMDAVQRRLREIAGVTVLIYEQTCAAELRRRRKKGEAARRAAPSKAAPPLRGSIAGGDRGSDVVDPARRIVINERVCEGCGDCSVQSNCVAVLPRETALGRKRQIDQSSCNKDYSCVKGFCPSFVTVEGGRLKKGKGSAVTSDEVFSLPEPQIISSETPYGVLVTGIGGTGVITIGQILGVAAHLEGKGVSVLDMSGLAQKYGAVMSHVQLAARPEALTATRIDTGGANLVIGGDLVVSASTEAVAKMASGHTRAVINATVTPTADFVRNPNWQLPGSDLRHDIVEACGKSAVDFVAATELATGLMGDAIATNMFLLGYAYQRGWLPVTGESLERAIELNGVAVELNKQSFLWGRRAAVDAEQVERLAKPA